jgi:hypothetical protein
MLPEREHVRPSPAGYQQCNSVIKKHSQTLRIHEPAHYGASCVVAKGIWRRRDRRVTPKEAVFKGFFALPVSHIPT